VLNRKWK